MRKQSLQAQVLLNKKIREMAAEGKVNFTMHAQLRLDERNISKKAVCEMLASPNNFIVEFETSDKFHYRNDRISIMVKDKKKKYKIVLDVEYKGSAMLLYVITAYEVFYELKLFNYNYRNLLKQFSQDHMRKTYA